MMRRREERRGEERRGEERREKREKKNKNKHVCTHRLYVALSSKISFSIAGCLRTFSVTMSLNCCSLRSSEAIAVLMTLALD